MRTRLRSRLSLLILSFAVAILVFPAMAFAETVAPDGTTSSSLPTIQSDKADYAPGELVTLTGGNWQPGESVNIKVNDDLRDRPGTATSTLPPTRTATSATRSTCQTGSWPTYNVTATGAQSGTATTTFTDANPQDLLVTPASQTVPQRRLAPPIP